MNRENPIFPILLSLIIGCMILLAFVGCKSLPNPVASTHEKNDNEHTEYRIDTIYRDRWHTEYQRGDTFFIHDSIDRWKIREVIIHDSIDNSRIDTIYQPVEIEKKGSAFWKGSGIAFWVLIGMLVLGAAIGLIIKFAK